MTPLDLQTRKWAGAASAVAQIAATAAGMLPWWALPLTLALTAIVSRPPGPLNSRRVQATRRAGVASVALFAGVITFKTVGAGTAGADPVATLRSLTEALVVLSLVMAPSAHTPREHRVLLTVTTGVLVAAAAGGHSATSAALAIASWIVLLTAISKVQISAAHGDGSVIAVAAGPVRPPSRLRSLRGTDGFVPVTAALIAGTIVFFALPSGLGGGGLAGRLAHRVDAANRNLPANRAAVGVDTYGDGDLNLLIRGTLPDTPILRVPRDSPALWRGTFYTTYTGTGWVTPFAPSPGFAPGADVAVPATPDDPKPAGRVRTDRATYATGFHGSLLWAPGVPQRVTGVGGSIVGVSRQSANARIVGAANITSYDVTSAVATTAPAKLRAATGPDPSDPRWTQLPVDLPPEISQLADQITAHAADRYAQVTDLETYLHAHETYSQDSPVPAVGQDAVDEFLFRDHVGFCEQFASAEAVMLRTLRVPARVVTGLAYGTVEGKTRLYTAANAHAWVEVYYPGIGWSPTDPTAGASLAPTTSSSRSSLTKALHALAGNLPGGRTGLVILALALLAGLAFSARAALRLRGACAEDRDGAAVRIGPVLAAFNRLAGHPRGPAPRAPPETAREYLGRVGQPGQHAQAVATLEQECYGATPPDPQASAAAVSAFDALVGVRRN